jgi:hypothetical protein
MKACGKSGEFLVCDNTLLPPDLEKDIFKILTLSSLVRWSLKILIIYFVEYVYYWTHKLISASSNKSICVFVPGEWVVWLAAVQACKIR